MGSFNISGFYWRRTLRIWPLYFTTVLFGFFIFQTLVNSVGGEIEETANVWYYLFFLGNFNSIINGAPVSGTLSVLWSIAIEEQFYLFWPILLLFFKKHRLALFIILLLISLGFRAMYLDQDEVIFYHTFSVMSDLVIGSWWAFYGKTISTFLLSLIFCRISFQYLESPFLRLKETSPTQIFRQKVK